MKELIKKIQDRIEEYENQSVFTSHQEQEREMMLSHYRNFLKDLNDIQAGLEFEKKNYLIQELKSLLESWNNSHSEYVVERIKEEIDVLENGL